MPAPWPAPPPKGAWDDLACAMSSSDKNFATAAVIRFERDPDDPGRFVYRTGSLELAIEGDGCFGVHELESIDHPPCDYADGCPEGLDKDGVDCGINPCPYAENEIGWGSSDFFSAGTYQKNRIYLQELVAKFASGGDAFHDPEDCKEAPGHRPRDPEWLAALKHAAHATWEMPV